MVDPTSFKKEIRKRILQEYSIEFLGDNFDNICRQISDLRAEKIYVWIERVIRDEIDTHPQKSTY